MASFRELLSEGRLGEVKLGMLPDAVERLLGPADDRSVKSRPIEILKFGSVELTFKAVPQTNDRRLIGIAIYFAFPSRSLPAKLVFDDWTPTRETTEAELRNFLRISGLSVHSKEDGENTYLILDSGATVIFDDGRLYSVQVSRADKLEARKQMSVSLPVDTVNQLRARAKRENISVQQLIEKVLSTTV